MWESSWRGRPNKTGYTWVDGQCVAIRGGVGRPGGRPIYLSFWAGFERTRPCWLSAARWGRCGHALAQCRALHGGTTIRQALVRLSRCGRVATHTACPATSVSGSFVAYSTFFVFIRDSFLVVGRNRKI
jgi:hypothetical protein